MENMGTRIKLEDFDVCSVEECNFLNLLSQCSTVHVFIDNLVGTVYVTQLTFIGTLDFLASLLSVSVASFQ